MTDNNKTLVSAGHELASELKADCGAVDVRSVANLLTELASALDVQSARSEALAAELKKSKIDVECYKHGMEQSNKRLTEIAAENAVLKSGTAYFSYGSEHQFEWHKTANEAVEAAEAAIDDYRGDACDGWSEEVDSICWGVIMQTSTKVGERSRNDDDCCDPSIDTVCDYALLPDIKTPATDAWVNEQRAAGRVEGVNFAAARLAAAFNNDFIDKPTAEVYDVVKAVLGAKEELATAPDDGLSGEYAEQALNDWASHLRGGQV